MRAATAAHHFGPGHAVAAVRVFLDPPGLQRLGETGPAAPRVVLLVRGEQLLTARGTEVDARRLRVPVGAGERPLGPLLAEYVILLVGELRAPFGVGFLDFVRHC